MGLDYVWWLSVKARRDDLGEGTVLPLPSYSAVLYQDGGAVLVPCLLLACCFGEQESGRAVLELVAGGR